MEMRTLRQAEDEEDEIILFELKEKQCWFISFSVFTTFHSLVVATNKKRPSKVEFVNVFDDFHSC